MTNTDIIWNETEKSLYINISCVTAGLHEKQENAARVILGEKVAEISDYAFAGCQKLCVIDARAAVNLKKIGAFSFYNCTGLAQAYFPTVTTCDIHAFEGCEALIMVYIPQCIKICDGTFKDTGLQSFDFKNVYSIGKEAFMNTFLEELSLPDNVRSIGHSAFSGTPVKTVKIGNGITTVPDRCFYDCRSLISVSGGNNVITLEDYAFSRCVKLNDAHFPSVRALGKCCFSNTGLEKMVFDEDISIMGHEIFSDCRNLKTIEFKGRLLNGFNDSLSGCRKLSGILINSYSNMNAVKNIRLGLRPATMVFFE